MFETRAALHGARAEGRSKPPYIGIGLGRAGRPRGDEPATRHSPPGSSRQRILCGVIDVEKTSVVHCGAWRTSHRAPVSCVRSCPHYIWCIGEGVLPPLLRKKFSEERGGNWGG